MCRLWVESIYIYIYIYIYTHFKSPLLHIGCTFIVHKLYSLFILKLKIWNQALIWHINGFMACSWNVNSLDLVKNWKGTQKMKHPILCSSCSWSLWSSCFWFPFHNYNCKVGFYKFNLCMFFSWPLFCSINCNPFINNPPIFLFFLFLTLWFLTSSTFSFSIIFLCKMFKYSSTVSTWD